MRVLLHLDECAFFKDKIDPIEHIIWPRGVEKDPCTTERYSRMWNSTDISKIEIASESLKSLLKDCFKLSAGHRSIEQSSFAMESSKSGSNWHMTISMSWTTFKVSWYPLSLGISKTKQPNHHGSRLVPSDDWMRTNAKLDGGRSHWFLVTNYDDSQNELWRKAKGVTSSMFSSFTTFKSCWESATVPIRPNQDTLQGSVDLVDATWKLVRGRVGICKVEFDIVPRAGVQNQLTYVLFCFKSSGPENTSIENEIFELVMNAIDTLEEKVDPPDKPVTHFLCENWNGKKSRKCSTTREVIITQEPD